MISLVFILATFSCSLSQNIYQLIVSRFIQSLCVSVFGVYSLVIIQQLKLPEQLKYFSFNNSIGILSPVIGPLICGFLIVHFTSWRISLYLILISLLLVTSLFGLVKLDLKEKKNNIEEKQTFTQLFINYIKKLKNKNMLLYLSGPGLLLGCIVSYLLLSPYIIIQEYNIPIYQYGFFHCIPISGYILGIGLANLITSKQKPAFIVYIPFLIIVLATLIIFFNLINMKNIFIFLCLIALVNFCIGYINNAFILNALSTSNVKSMTAAAIGIIGGIICSFFTIIISVLCYNKLIMLAIVYILISIAAFPISKNINKYKV
jgi:DHA1 family bicyclomycin/chloramphenicol resistance-like MFS transporter